MQGDILKEVKILKEILIETEKTYGENTDEYIKVLNELGGSLKYIGAYQEAENNLDLTKQIITKK